MQRALKEADAQITELKQLEQLITEAQERADYLKDKLKALMGDTETLRTGTFTINYKTINSTRFNSTAFKAAEPDLYKSFCEPMKSRRFSIA